MTALRQFLMRVPPPERYKRGGSIVQPSVAARDLALLYIGDRLQTTGQLRGLPVNLPALQILTGYGATGFLMETAQGVRRMQSKELPPNAWAGRQPFFLPLDLTRETLVLAEKYAAVDSTGSDEDKHTLEMIRGGLKEVEANYTKATSNFERDKERDRPHGGTKLSEQVAKALQHNLAGEALRLLTDPGTDLAKEFGRDALQAILLRVALELATGRLEDAAADIEVLPVKLEEVAARPQDAQRVACRSVARDAQTPDLSEAPSRGELLGGRSAL